MNKSIKLKKSFALWSIIICVLGFVSGCTYYVKAPPPPPAKVEVRPPRPHRRAVWVPGHWRWRRRRYIWIPGHWRVR